MSCGLSVTNKSHWYLSCPNAKNVKKKKTICHADYRVHTNRIGFCRARMLKNVKHDNVMRIIGTNQGLHERLMNPFELLEKDLCPPVISIFIVRSRIHETRAQKKKFVHCGNI